MTHVVEGVITDAQGIRAARAATGAQGPGGIREVQIPNAAQQVKVKKRQAVRALTNRAEHSMETMRKPTQRREQRVEFLGEQDGPPERELKDALRIELRQFPKVKRAYLARVGYAPDATPAVALCLAPSGAEDRGVVDRVLKVFAGLFSTDAYIDVLFPNHEQELDLRRVCSPFFEIDASSTS